MSAVPKGLGSRADVNEQPFADPAKPTTPDLSSREQLTKQINELQETQAKCIALNDAKGAVIALQQENVLLRALLIDELQSVQQMFERIDKRMADMPSAIIRAIDERIHREQSK